MSPAISITRRAAGPYNLNTYFLTCEKTRRTLIVDPGGRASDLAAFLNQQKMIPEKVLMTHGHADHLFSMTKFKALHEVPYGIHRDDDLFFKQPDVQETTRRMVGLPPPHPADLLLEEGMVLSVGASRVSVIHTPGHTPGSVCFLAENHLLTGDAIFVGEAGRVDLPGGDLERLIHSIKTKILCLDPDTIIHPGHYHTGDAYESTIRREMKTNIYITDFILDP